MTRKQKLNLGASALTLLGMTSLLPLVGVSALELAFGGNNVWLTPEIRKAAWQFALPLAASGVASLFLAHKTEQKIANNNPYYIH